MGDAQARRGAGALLRVQNTEAPDSTKLQEPVQIGSRSFDPAQQENTEDQLENSRYMGFTITE